MRDHAMRSMACFLGVLLLLAACAGPDVPTPPQTDPPANESELAGRIRYSCGGSAFDLEIMLAPGIAENGTDEVAFALRAALAPGGLPDAGLSMPAAGWHRIGLDNMDAEFVNFTQARPLYIRFHRVAGGSWAVSGWGDCQPEITLPDGLGVATWALDPAEPPPGPESTRFIALVTERACASGQPADGRIVGPEVLRLDDRVLVIFAVRPLGGAQMCPSNPSTRVTVDLGEPLGDRELVDPSVLFTDE